MSYDSIEKSGFSSVPYELYWFRGAAAGIEFLLTSADTPIVYGGRTFSPATISRTEIDQSQEMNAGEMKVELPKGHQLSQLFIPYLPAVPIHLVIYGGHDGDTEVVVIFSGDVASARYTDQCELLCKPEQAALQKKIPAKLYQSGCPRVFGAPDCGVGLALYTYSGTIKSIDSTGTVLTVAAFGSVPSPFTLRGGYLRRGNDYRMIVDHSAQTITLLSAISGLNVGDQVFGVAGCAHTYASCHTFNNVGNFLGFDLIPARNPFQGSLE